MPTPNSLATRVKGSLLARYPEWSKHVSVCDENDLEFSLPSPQGSKAGRLVVSVHGEEIWIRYSPPHMAYPVDDLEELLSIVDQLLEDRAIFAVTTQGEKWIETTLIRPDEAIHLQPEEEALVVSWSGKYDRSISGPASGSEE